MSDDIQEKWYREEKKKVIPYSEVHSEPCQTSKMELFAKIVNEQKPSTVLANSIISHIWQGCE